LTPQNKKRQDRKKGKEKDFQSLIRRAKELINRPAAEHSCRSDLLAAHRKKEEARGSSHFQQICFQNRLGFVKGLTICMDKTLDSNAKKLLVLVFCHKVE
jgi:hypothetical protein